MTSPEQHDPRERAEAFVVRAALTRSYLSEGQVREALLLREQLRVSGRPAELLRLLGSRFLKPEHLPELTELYFDALAQFESGEHDPIQAKAQQPPAELFTSSADELAIPEFLLKSSSEQLQKPPAEDPQAVQDFMAASAESDPDDVAGGDVPQTELAKDLGKSSGMWRWLKDRLGGK